MTVAPAPLTPADCDLRDFQFMPLDVVRLRDSDLAIHVTGEEFRCAVLLWCASWHQVPAASLPDDDRILSNLAGYGRAVGEWQKSRAGALRGWMKCSDGRLYHPVVAEKAQEAWTSKHAYAHKKLLERIRKKGVPKELWPTLEQWISAGKPSEWPIVSAGNCNVSGGNAHDSAGNDDFSEHSSAGIPPEKALKGQGQGEYINPAASPAGDAQAPAHTRDRDPRDRFQIDPDWQPSPEFPAQLVMAGVVPENLLTVSNLAEFVSYWRADGAAKTHAQWEHALLKNLIAIRDRSLGGARHANRPANPQRLTPFQRVVAANPLGGRSPAAGRVIDAEPD